MTKLAGVTIERDAKGKAKAISFNIKKHSELLEDILDGLEAKQRIKDADFVPWEAVKAELDKHHGIKRK